MTTPLTAKQEYMSALQTQRDIQAWLDKPRCTQCERYDQITSNCQKFGPVPPDAAFVIHATPCPEYMNIDDIPF